MPPAQAKSLPAKGRWYHTAWRGQRTLPRETLRKVQILLGTGLTAPSLRLPKDNSARSDPSSESKKIRADLRPEEGVWFAFGNWYNV